MFNNYIENSYTTVRILDVSSAPDGGESLYEDAGHGVPAAQRIPLPDDSLEQDMSSLGANASRKGVQCRESLGAETVKETNLLVGPELGIFGSRKQIFVPAVLLDGQSLFDGALGVEGKEFSVNVFLSLCKTQDRAFPLRNSGKD